MSEEERQGVANHEPPEISQKPDSIDLNLHFPDLAKIAASFERVGKNLIKAISTGVGRLYAPVGVIREARAEQEAILIRAKTVLDLGKMGNIPEDAQQTAMQRRAFERLLNEAVGKQANRERVLEETRSRRLELTGWAGFGLSPRLSLKMIYAGFLFTCSRER